jgi:hypothetical protein
VKLPRRLNGQMVRELSRRSVHCLHSNGSSMATTIVISQSHPKAAPMSSKQALGCRDSFAVACMFQL